MKMASRLIDLISKKTNCTCSTLFLLISKKQICTCSKLFCLSLAVVFARLQRCFVRLKRQTSQLHIIFMDELSHVFTQCFVSCVHVRFYFSLPLIFTSLAPPCWSLAFLIRDFKIQRRGRTKNVKKTIGLISKTTTLHVHHAFLYISLPVFARLRREHA